jgi:hypothetical protein
MTQLMQEGNTANVPFKSYVVDSTTEMNGLPKEFGTLVLNLEDASFYVCNGSGTFVKIN